MLTVLRPGPGNQVTRPRCSEGQPRICPVLTQPCPTPVIGTGPLPVGNKNWISASFVFCLQSMVSIETQSSQLCQLVSTLFKWRPSTACWVEKLSVLLMGHSVPTYLDGGTGNVLVRFIVPVLSLSPCLSLCLSFPPSLPPAFVPQAESELVH